MLKWLRAGAREGAQVREGEFGCCWEICDDLIYFAAMKMGGVGQIN